MQIYSFRTELYGGFKNFADADAQVIGENLGKITARSGGRLKPDAVVREASKRSHPLHRYFEWSDSIAAQAYRLDQARALISSIEITSSAAKEPARAYLSINDREGRAYHQVSEVINSRDLQLGVLRLALRDLEAFQRRFREIEDICQLVRMARDRLASKVDELSPDHPSA